MIDTDRMEHDMGLRRQFITFHLGAQEFGADIMRVREIRGWTATTPLPHAPDHVLGVINLRGVVLPVVDLKARLGLGSTQADPKHVIMVLEAGGRTIGLLVDAVSDIMTVMAEAIQPAPDLARDPGSECIDGLAALEGRMVTVLSMERLVAGLAGQAARAA